MKASRSGNFPHKDLGALLAKGVFAGMTLSLLVAPAVSVRRLSRRALPVSNPQANDSGKKWAGLLAHQPLRFEKNEGQSGVGVDYLARGLGFTVFLTRQGAVLALRSQKPEAGSQKSESRQSSVGSRQLQKPATADDGQRTTDVLRMKLVGANPAAQATVLDELPGQVNYFIGNDPGKWRRNVATYGEVAYRGVYPGVDLVYHGNPAAEGKLEYDFVVAPGADPRAIGLAIEPGDSKAEIAANGDLVVGTGSGQVRFHKPVVYQEQDSGSKSPESEEKPGTVGKRRWTVDGLSANSKIGTRKYLEGGYVLSADRRVHFEVAGYDKTRPLVLDPVLDYSTYLGGTGADLGLAIAVDSAGNAYIAGTTSSGDFPTKAGFASGYRGSGDAFISKFNFVAGTGTGTGLTMVYSTYLGGTGADSATAIALDISNDVYVTGSTTSSDFPIAPGKCGGTAPLAFQPCYGGVSDAFVTELSSTGDSLVYSSYLGGNDLDIGQGIAVDKSGNAYVTGATHSSTFPTAAPSGSTPIQAANGGGSDAFVAKVGFGGTSLLYSTYLGGSALDSGQSIAVDSSGNAYVAGFTKSSNFPVLNPLPGQGANPGAAASFSDAFVAEVNSTGSALNFSTYLGGTQGTGSTSAFGLALDTSSSPNIYVAGETTSSTDFPTSTGAYQTTYGGGGDAFVTKLQAGGKSIVYSTYLGGSDIDQANSIAVDASGDAFVTGFTNSSASPPAGFPTLNAVQASFGLTGGSACGGQVCPDAFVTELKPDGTGLIYSTFLGGNSADFGNGIALDPSGLAYVAGSTSSTNFPVIAGATQGELKGQSGNSFIAKIDSASVPALVIVPQTVNFGNQTEGVTSQPITVTMADGGTAPLTISSVNITQPTNETGPGDFAVPGATDNCTGTIQPGVACTLQITLTPTVQPAGLETGTVTVTDNTSTSPHTFTLQGTGVTVSTEVTLSPTSISFANQTVGSSGAAQTVKITNTGTQVLNITNIVSTNKQNFLLDNSGCISAPVNGVLNLGQSCTVSVTFAPQSSGALSAAIQISDNATGSPQSVPLTGTGVAQFSLAASPSTATSQTVVVGSTTATYTVTASGPSSFTGSITLLCTLPAGITYTFNPSSILEGQTSTLTLSGLTASTTSPLNFNVTGESGSQNATLPLTLLLANYTLSGSPQSVTVLQGAPANYTITVTPTNGFNQAVTMGCSGLPPGARCAFTKSSVTLGGSPVTTGLTITTTKAAVAPHLRWPPAGGWPRFMLWWLAFLVGLLGLIRLERGLRVRLSPARTSALRWKVALAGMALGLAALAGSCRNVIGAGPTPTQNYFIQVTGTLQSNTTVVNSTTVDLIVTPIPTTTP